MAFFIFQDKNKNKQCIGPKSKYIFRSTKSGGRRYIEWRNWERVKGGGLGIQYIKFSYEQILLVSGLISTQYWNVAFH